jgi:hypothetical protein
MINKLMLSLYSYYRKKNEPFAASFHSKALLSFFILMLLSILVLLISDEQKELPLTIETVKIALSSTIIFITGAVSLFTDSSRVLESKREYTNTAYKTYFFVLFYLLIPILIYAIVIARS